MPRAPPGRGGNAAVRQAEMKELFAVKPLSELRKSLEATPCGPQWKVVGVHHRHGICAPLFCLHSERSCGIGEYGDLSLLIDWCASLGLSVIQLLPINDTLDAPYSSFSAFALNPSHLTIADADWLPFPGVVKEDPELSRLMEEIRMDTRTRQSEMARKASREREVKQQQEQQQQQQQQQQEEAAGAVTTENATAFTAGMGAPSVPVPDKHTLLHEQHRQHMQAAATGSAAETAHQHGLGQQGSGAAHRVDYAFVRSRKLFFVERMFAVLGAAGLVVSSPQFSEFCAQNHHWLHGYAVYSVLRERHQHAPWESWPEPFNQGRSAFSVVEHEERERILYYKFVQYLCYFQMRRVRAQADARGVLLKGDLPILVGRDSADVWLFPEYFRLGYEAGAPPDVYSINGQGWGFPPYNWEAMARDGYWWWRERVRYASQFYHIYRIDHIVGFYRLWHIPRGQPPTKGFFYPYEQSEWVPHGEKLLRVLLEAAPVMLPIGEDLGDVPDAVRVSLRKLGICSTKVVRWERRYKMRGSPFITLSQYPQVSMCTVSSHDSETVRQWWERHPDEAVVFARYLGLLGLLRDGVPCPPWTPAIQQRTLREAHQASSLFHINLLQEYLAAASGEDPSLCWDDIDDERINVPGTVSPLNWTTVTRASLERICHSEPLRRIIRAMLPADCVAPLPTPATPYPNPPPMRNIDLPALRERAATIAAATAPLPPPPQGVEIEHQGEAALAAVQNKLRRGRVTHAAAVSQPETLAEHAAESGAEQPAAAAAAGAPEEQGLRRSARARTRIRDKTASRHARTGSADGDDSAAASLSDSGSEAAAGESGSSAGDESDDAWDQRGRTGKRTKRDRSTSRPRTKRAETAAAAAAAAAAADDATGAAERVGSQGNAAHFEPQVMLVAQDTVVERSATGGFAPPTGEGSHEMSVDEALEAGGEQAKQLREALAHTTQ